MKKEDETNKAKMVNNFERVGDRNFKMEKIANIYAYVIDCK